MVGRRRTSAAVLVVYAGWRLWRSGGNIVLGVVFLGVGGIIMAAHIAWLVTGGSQGSSSIHMRGGWFGFWLSPLTAVEVLALGLIALLAARPWMSVFVMDRRRSSLLAPFGFLQLQPRTQTPSPAAPTASKGMKK